MAEPGLINGFYGKHETYGTYPQWLEGEGVADLYPATSGSLSPTYAHPIIGDIAENPLLNLLQDSGRIVQEGPNALDIALLGLSAVPAANVPIRAVASKIGTRYNSMLDKPILMSGHKIPNTIRYKLRTARERAELNKLEKLKASEESDMLASKAEERRQWLIRKKTLEDQLASKGFETNKTLEELSSNVPDNVHRLLGSKSIKEMTWREFDGLSESAVNLSSLQNAMMRAENMTPEDVLHYFWGKGARKDWEDRLSYLKSKEKLSDEAFDEMYADDLAFIRERDLKSGWVEEQSTKELLDDIAWGRVERAAHRQIGDDPMIIADKYSLKPEHVDSGEWVRLTRDLAMHEVEKLARKMTLRLIK